MVNDKCTSIELWKHSSVNRDKKIMKNTKMHLKLFEYLLKYGHAAFLDKKLKNINTRQLVNMGSVDELFFSYYEVNFEYTTAHGNKKNGIRIFYFDSPSPEINIKEQLEKYINDFNKKFSKRPLLNVKYLSSKLLGTFICNV